MEEDDDRASAYKKSEDADNAEELKVLTATLNAFYAYPATAKYNLVNPRRRKYERLSEEYKTLIDSFFLHHLDSIEDAIEDNAFFLARVADAAVANFGAPERGQWAPCTGSDVDKVNSTLRQVAREWSVMGVPERQVSFGRVLRDLATMYPDRIERHKVRVLVPGCGLGRLPMELAALGFQAQGNEFSFHMLFTSSFILNHTSAACEYRIRPNIQTFSHNRTKEHQLKEVLIPDVHPGMLTQHAMNDEHIPPEGLLSMSAGSFDMIYPPPPDELFDVVTTVFFLDTAPNIFNTLRVISDSLRPGGIWINFGPLLWHYEEVMPVDDNVSLDRQSNQEDRSCGLEMSLEDLLELIPTFGFRFEKRESGIPSMYTNSPESMGGFMYLCEYWIAIKEPTPSVAS
ncbi:carnosine N-methyltransferase [Trichomonascus vanleenenianus]|uniref:carnosine N-methyltransferase n=1 Tax=Trichomonascus vanleenenianus TaxID=2268995 RepID=UPI003ECA20BB